MKKALSSNRISQDDFLEYENVIIGAIILQEHWYSFYDGIKSQMFLYPPNQILWKCILHLRESKIRIDIISIHLEVKKKYKPEDFPDGNAISYISRCTDRVASISESNMQRYTLYLTTEYINRKSVKTFQTGIQKIIEENEVPSTIAKICYDYIVKLESNSLESFIEGDSDIKNHVEKTLKDFKEKEKGTSLSTIPTGYLQLDRVINGINMTDMLVIAARPGMGKTALAVCIARNLAMNKHPVGIISLEMSAIQIVNRLISIGSRTNSQLTRNPKIMTDSQKVKYYEEADQVAQLPIYIEEKARLTVEQIIMRAKEMIKKYKIVLLIVDYLQLIENSFDNKTANPEQQISHISRSLKVFAKEENICVMPLAQLSREVEKRADKTPILSDLRGSGAIEQDADEIVFLMRPSYYGINKNANGEDLSHVLKAIVAKNRHGSTQSVYLYFDNVTTSVVDSKLKLVDYQEPVF